MLLAMVIICFHDMLLHWVVIPCIAQMLEEGKLDTQAASAA